MFAANNTGKTIGTLLLIQLIAGMYIQFGVMSQIIAKPGFLYSGIVPGMTIGLTIIVSFIISSFNILIAAICHREFKHQRPLLTNVLLVLAGAKLAISMTEFTNLLEMISFSQQYVAANAETKLMLEALSPMLSAGRNWAHFIQVATTGVFILCFYLLLFRASQTPLALCAIAITAVSIQIAAVTQPFFGNTAPLPMLAPIALIQLLMPLYFIVKGIKARPMKKDTN